MRLQIGRRDPLPSNSSDDKNVLCACRSLDLSDNALGEKGVRACAAAIESQVSDFKPAEQSRAYRRDAL